VRKTTVILSIALAGTTATAGWLWNELETQRARNSELSARASTQTTAPAIPAPPLASDVHALPVASTTPPATPIQPPANSGTEDEDWVERQRRLLQDPKYRAAYRESERVRYANWRDDAIRLLGFTPREANAVIDLMIDRRIAAATATASAASVVDVTPEVIQKLNETRASDERAFQDSIRAQVGENKRARWENYVASLPDRRLAGMVQARLSDADAMRADQIEALIAALSTERRQYVTALSELGDSLLSDNMTGDKSQRYRDQAAALLEDSIHRQHAAASSLLTTTQLESLDELLQQDLDQLLAQHRTAQIGEKLDQQAGTRGH
jgi:hypothetical protein